MSLQTRESCHDWKELARRAFAADDVAETCHAGEEGASENSNMDHAAESDWLRALKHQNECGACRTEALAVEPTVLFRRMPQVELSADEIETMRQRVAGVRRGRAVANGAALKPKRRRLHWLSAAAVLAVSVAGTLNLTVTQVGAAGLTAADEAALEASLGAQPLVEGIDLYGTDQTVLMVGQVQGASGEVDFAWVVDGDLVQ